MTHSDLTSLTLFGKYDQKELAERWGYKSYDAIRRGIVTPAGTNIVILFVTEKKVSYATQYSDELVEDTLFMSGETGHVNDNRLKRNLQSKIDTIYLFYRSVHHTPYTYYGSVTIVEADIRIGEPSHFVFTVDSLKKEESIMKFFGFKISQPSAENLVHDVKQCKDNIEIFQLNQLETELKIGRYVFISLGGDKVPWDKGLIGLSKITKEPYDKGYDSSNARNFKLGMKMLFSLPEVMKREEFIYYPDAYDAAGIGPNTKGEQNQAIKSLEEKQVVSILRAMVDKYPHLQTVYWVNFPEELCKKIFGTIKIMYPELTSYGEKAITKLTDLSKANVVSSDEPRCTGGENVLLYGVPGSGKSYTVKTEYCKNPSYMERLVFHPDYTYSDFAGQILPKVNPETQQIVYRFVPGPFARILKKAIFDPANMYYLVIEELNRGNAPAIFGDVFQLLDRDDAGNSEYKISNKDIAEYVYGNDESAIYLPSNLSIISTMNTSDQNIFTLDTAFKRRWKMRMIKNDIAKSTLANIPILGGSVTWKIFAERINELIVSENSDAMSTEDKRLGAFFVHKSDLELKDGEYHPAFAEKVIMYLWNDVFKYDREIIFKEKYHSLEDVISAFETERLNVFNIDFPAI